MAASACAYLGRYAGNWDLVSTRAAGAMATRRIGGGKPVTVQVVGCSSQNRLRP